MLKIDDNERPISIQIFGSDVDTFVKAAKFVEENSHPDIIDINMGCPVPKVALKSQAGSALLKNPQKIYEIVTPIFVGKILYPFAFDWTSPFIV